MRLLGAIVLFILSVAGISKGVWISGILLLPAIKLAADVTHAEFQNFTAILGFLALVGMVISMLETVLR